MLTKMFLLWTSVFLTTLAVELFLFLLLMILGNGIVRQCQDYEPSKAAKVSKWLLIKILSLKGKLDGSMPVVLIDYKDRIYITMADERKDTDTLSSYVYYFTQVGPILLRPDGTVSDVEQDHCYIYNWLPIDIEKRTWMILQGARGFEY